MLPMKHAIPYFAVLIVILYGAYNTFNHHKKSTNHASSASEKTINQETREHIEQELARIDTPAYTYRYIIDIINHGSATLHFKPKEIMEGGFASREDAPKIACYVLSLAHETCPVPSSTDAAMYFSSNCAGCHGEDGKGIHGTYPDLTRRPLLGIEKRKVLLYKLLKK